MTAGTFFTSRHHTGESAAFTTTNFFTPEKTRSTYSSRRCSSSRSSRAAATTETITSSVTSTSCSPRAGTGILTSRSIIGNSSPTTLAASTRESAGHRHPHRWARPRRGAMRGKAFFVSEQRKRLHRSTVNLLLITYSRAASLPLLAHPHMLRHACGFALADQGADTRLIQDYLGHRNIQHTVKYTATNPTRFEKLWR